MIFEISPFLLKKASVEKKKTVFCKAHVTAFNDGLASDLDDCVVVLGQCTLTLRYLLEYYNRYALCNQSFLNENAC